MGWTHGKKGREWLMKRTNLLRVKGRRIGRLRWEDCVKRFSGRGGENESEGWGE